MKIWYVTMIFPAQNEAFAASDIRALRNIGAEVSVHALRPAVPGWRRILRERSLEGLEVTHGGATEIFAGLWIALTCPFRSLKLLVWVVRCSDMRTAHLLKALLLVPRTLQLVASIERERPEVVHLFWGHYPSLVGYLLKRTPGRPVLSIFLGAYDLWRNFRGTREVARKADLVWTHADFNVDQIVALGVERDRIQVVHRGIELGRIQREELVRIPRRLLSAGRLIPVKRMEAVLAAFRTVREHWADASLLILGEGPERPRLEKMIHEWGLSGSVELRGHVPHDEVFAEMAISEVFLLLSRSERLPNAAKEAMALGCACVVTDTEGIRELITHGKSGFIVDNSAKPQEVAAFVSRVFSEPGLRESLKTNAWEVLRRDFDSKASMQKYLDAWSREVHGGNQVGVLSGRKPAQPKPITEQGR